MDSNEITVNCSTCVTTQSTWHTMVGDHGSWGEMVNCIEDSEGGRATVRTHDDSVMTPPLGI